MLNAWEHERFYILHERFYILITENRATARIFTDFSSIRWLSLFTVALVVVWAFAARYAGRQFTATEEREAAREETTVTAG